MNKEPLRILLADDDEADRFLFKEAFKEMEMEINFKSVNDGVQLMEYLAIKDMDLPDLLFLDLNMPRKNGLTCLQEIRSNTLFNNISIAIYSTSISYKDVEETFQNGANVYIKKPNNFDELLQVLTKAVGAVHSYGESPFIRVNYLIQI